MENFTLDIKHVMTSIIMIFDQIKHKDAFSRFFIFHVQGRQEPRE